MRRRCEATAHLSPCRKCRLAFRSVGVITPPPGLFSQVRDYDHATDLEPNSEAYMRGLKKAKLELKKRCPIVHAAKYGLPSNTMALITSSYSVQQRVLL